ncbi:hypothetical protein TW83_01035 [Paracoccus sp. S4493]|nr:hypothetical protein TW83_01035 [Paracoccus sp. S4493]
MLLALDDALNTHVLYQSGDCATGDIDAFPIQLTPDLAHAVDAPVLFENTRDLGPQRFVAPDAIRQSGRIGPFHKRGIQISLSGRGNCYDNAMVETFFKTIKSELIWPVAWQSRQQAENTVARYINGFYNPVRRHLSLGFKSPIAFKRKGGELS